MLTGGDAICREMKNEKRNSNPFFNVMRMRKRQSEAKFKCDFHSVAQTKIKSAFQCHMGRQKMKMEMEMEFCFTRPKKNEKKNEI